MGKTFYTYVLLITGISLIFYFGGLINNPLIQILLEPQNMSTGSFALATILGVAAIGAAIIIGWVTKDIEKAIMAPMAIYVFSILINFVQVHNRIKAENPVLAPLIFGSILLLFVLTMVDWWRGRD